MLVLDWETRNTDSDEKHSSSIIAGYLCCNEAQDLQWSIVHRWQGSAEKCPILLGLQTLCATKDSNWTSDVWAIQVHVKGSSQDASLYLKKGVEVNRLS
jgi:hypothetical protein